ncbi:hypothetical protein TNCV_2617831 [Trichonephila clavipes]|nr:hypothetical protein TNCV_2617831 [Trichonephila clavipes]
MYIPFTGYESARLTSILSVRLDGKNPVIQPLLSPERAKKRKSDVFQRGENGGLLTVGTDYPVLSLALGCIKRTCQNMGDVWENCGLIQ